jgi:hypothetical protein
MGTLHLAQALIFFVVCSPSISCGLCCGPVPTQGHRAPTSAFGFTGCGQVAVGEGLNPSSACPATCTGHNTLRDVSFHVKFRYGGCDDEKVCVMTCNL